MNKTKFQRRKSRVSKDFDATLQTIIRSLSREEINIIDAYKTDDDKKDFYQSIGDNTLSSNSSLKLPERRQSVYRNNSFSKYEVVVDIQSNSMNSNIISDSLETKIFTRPIRTSKESLSEFPKVFKSKSSKYFQRFLPIFSHINIPFERTTVTSLPFHVNINIKGKGKLSVQVTEFYTINYLKSKISKKENIEFQKQALFHKEKRLEGTSLLYSYGIKSNTVLKLKYLELLSIICLFNTMRISLKVYTSITISEIKVIIAKEIVVDPNEIELQYTDLILEDNKELFVYNISEGSEIKVIIIKEADESLLTKGHQAVDKFIQMTNNLTKCKCIELRIQVISDLLLSTFDCSSSETEIQRKRQFLLEFDKTRHYHHIYCFKLLSSPKTFQSNSQCSSFSELVSTSYSGSDSSVKSAVIAEHKRLSMRASLKIDERYTKMIAECKDFKVFKHLLKDKIGTKCNLRSVALLYKYARETVRYIGINEEENSPEVNKILAFTKLYFEKYFKKYIVDKGGLDALTLTGSDVD